MLQEGIYTLSDLRAVLKESDAKNEFEPVLGNGVEKDNKKNNGEAVKDITDKVGEYNGERMPHTIVTPFDGNKTPLDVRFTIEPGEDYKERVKEQVKGYPSVDNAKNTDTKDNGGLEYEGNEDFYNNRKEINKELTDKEEDLKRSGLATRELPKEVTEINTIFESEEFGFDAEDDYMTTPDIVAKDFIKWATSEADKAPYPINAMQMIYDAYVNKDQEALEDVATAYFEAKYTDMAQWETVMKGVEKAVNAFGYYNLSNEEELNTSETDSMTDSENNDTMGSQIDNNNGEDEIKEPEPLDENKKNNSKGNMKRIHFKKTTFLTESQMFNQIPETFKTNGNRFYVKDASGTEYLLECTVDEKFDLPKLSVVSKLNEGKTNSEIDRMKQLFGYESSNYFTKVNKGGENMSNLHEQIEKVKELEKVND